MICTWVVCGGANDAEIHSGRAQGDAAVVGTGRDEAGGASIALSRSDQEPALRSYLTTLLEKGHVARRRVGKAYYYKATTRPAPAFRSMLADLVDAYCGGSVRALVMNIIKSEKLSEDELIALKKLADGEIKTLPKRGRVRK